jgi:hypothetical protein
LDEAAPDAAKRPDGLTAVASGGAVLTRRGVADLQHLAGNKATRALIEAKATQRQSAQDPALSAPEEAWEGSIKGHLGDNISLYHTLNNFGDKQLEYVLRIHSRGYAMVSLETQYEYKTAGLQEKWTALYAQRGQTQEVTNGLPPHSSLHLRFFGERDHTQKNQSYFEGSVEVRRKK